MTGIWAKQKGNKDAIVGDIKEHTLDSKYAENTKWEEAIEEKGLYKDMLHIDYIDSDDFYFVSK